MVLDTTGPNGEKENARETARLVEKKIDVEKLEMERHLKFRAIQAEWRRL